MDNTSPLPETEDKALRFDSETDSAAELHVEGLLESTRPVLEKPQPAVLVLELLAEALPVVIVGPLELDLDRAREEVEEREILLRHLVARHVEREGKEAEL